MKSCYTVDFPLERPHCGVPLANGCFGAEIWGEDRINISVNQADFWDRRTSDEISPLCTYERLIELDRLGAPRIELEEFFRIGDTPQGPLMPPTRLPVGRFEVLFKNGARPSRGVLDYTSGVFTVELDNGGKVFFEMALRCNYLKMNDPDGLAEKILCRPSWEFPRSRERLEKIGFAPPEIRPDGWIVRCPDEQDGELYCRYRKECDGFGFFTGQEELTAAADEFAFARKFWQDFHAGMPEFSLPDNGEYTDFFSISVWRIAAATLPFGYACGLQGPWIEEYQPAPWSGDYHFNVNVQMIYNAMLVLNRPDFLMPLFDMLESETFTANLRKNSLTLFGDDSAYYFIHALDDRGLPCGGVHAGACLDPACGAWTAQLYYRYWQLTGDVEFLKKRAYPFISKVMRGYELMLDKDLNIPLAVSAEYSSSNPDVPAAGRNPSYQLAAMRMLAHILLECSDVLGCEAKPLWRDIVEKVPKFTIAYGRDRYGTRQMEKRIGIWEGLDLLRCHRHHSHLATIYPFTEFAEYTAEEQTVIENSIDHWLDLGRGEWSEWCVMWAIEIICRMGFNEVPEILLHEWKRLFVNEGNATVYLPRFRGSVAHRRHDIMRDKKEYEVMQLDGSAGFISAFTAMFCYFEKNRIFLWRGIPAAWRKKASFCKVALPGNWLVSADFETLTLENGSGTVTVVIDGREYALAPGKYSISQLAEVKA
ncbi:MAG: hypothetical protein E7058_09120 [Lentisphaerae bacterium]|nr:hypothetical protein [Lentisphaerota bacterium]